MSKNQPVVIVLVLGGIILTVLVWWFLPSTPVEQPSLLRDNLGESLEAIQVLEDLGVK